jgi:hypothetical protein
MANNSRRSKKSRSAELRSRVRNAPAGETNCAQAHPQPDVAKPFVVKSEIHQKDGSPVASLMVKAFDTNLRSEELLGETTTDECGAYQSLYTAEQFSHGGNDRADLIVRAFDKEASGEFGPNQC